MCDDMSKIVHARTTAYNVGYHMVWSTKYRRKVLVGKVGDALKGILREIAKEKGFVIKEMEVMADHVHLFASDHPKIAPGYIYKMAKGISARRIFVLHPEIKKSLWGGNLWNPSTYVETVGHISEEVVRKYIEDQKSK